MITINVLGAIEVDWAKSVAVESRDGKRKTRALCVDWMRPGPDGRFPKITGHLPNIPGGGEGGTASVTQGDWLVLEDGAIHPIHADAFRREWIDIEGEKRRVVEAVAKAQAQVVLAAQNEAARKAKEIADAKRLMDEKRDAEKRARDGSGA